MARLVPSYVIRRAASQSMEGLVPLLKKWHAPRMFGCVVKYGVEGLVPLHAPRMLLSMEGLVQPVRLRFLLRLRSQSVEGLVPRLKVACASYVTEYWPDHVPAVRLRCSQFGCVVKDGIDCLLRATVGCAMVKASLLLS